MSKKAQHIVEKLFDAFMNDPKMLTDEYRRKVKIMESNAGDAGRARIVADYIAGMTDRYAIMEYNKLFDPLQLT